MGFVFEFLRHLSAVPLGLPHGCYGEDVEINGYKIYQGTEVFINHLAIHHLQDEDGKEFKIERWLDENGRFSLKYQRESFLIFGHSTRDCVGKNIAKQELFAIFAFIIRRYQVYNDDL